MHKITKREESTNEQPECFLLNFARRFMNIVTMPKRVRYSLNAGSAYGIMEDALFTVYSNDDVKSTPLGVQLIVRSTTAFSAELEVDSSSPQHTLDLPSTAYALQTRPADAQRLKMSIRGEDPELLSAFENVETQMREAELRGKPGITPRSSSPTICLVLSGGQVVFEIHEKTCEEQGLTEMYYRVPCDAAKIFPVISSAAHFFFHLHRSDKGRSLTASNRIRLECFELSESYDDDEFEAVRRETGENLIKGGSLSLSMDGTSKERIFGYKVVNDTKRLLYAALFYFYMSDMSISKSAPYSLNLFGPSSALPPHPTLNTILNATV